MILILTGYSMFEVHIFLVKGKDPPDRHTRVLDYSVNPGSDTQVLSELWIFPINLQCVW